MQMQQRPPGPPPPPSPFPGLLYTDGRDAVGRPVVVVNTAMLPAKAKKDDVLEYMLQQLQPVVQRVSDGGEAGGRACSCLCLSGRGGGGAEVRPGCGVVVHVGWEGRGP